MTPTPESLARQTIDAAHTRCGWLVQDFRHINLGARAGIAVREYPLKGEGLADYLLYANGEAVGIVEAKREGTPRIGVEVQTRRYAAAKLGHVPAPVLPLPFLYESTGVETRFTNLLDPEPKSRSVFAFHRPETLAAWNHADPLWLPMVDGQP